MGEKLPYKDRVEILQGTLDMLILLTLRAGPMHGYGITNGIRSRSEDVLQVETGSLYPALHRLEKKRWVEANWGVTENNQRARFYQLTAAGRKQLLRESENWERLVAAISRLMGPAKETL